MTMRMVTARMALRQIGACTCVKITYTWSANEPAADGTAFWVFLHILNNTCDGDEATACTSDADCAGNGNGLCGHAGYTDWMIPNIKVLESIVDYSEENPAIDPLFPGATHESTFDESFYWSSTSDASSPGDAWRVDFNFASIVASDKNNVFRVRAVRGGP